MIEVKSSVQLSDADFENIKEIVSALEPFKLAVEALCRRDINLVTADAAVKLAVVQLEKQHSELAKTLAVAVWLRISQRCNEIAGILAYLSNPMATSIDDSFSVANSRAIQRTVCKTCCCI